MVYFIDIDFICEKLKIKQFNSVKSNIRIRFKRSDNEIRSCLDHTPCRGSDLFLCDRPPFVVVAQQLMDGCGHI